MRISAKLYFGISVILISRVSVAGGFDKIDLLWKARGLQAVERIEKLGKKNGDSKGKNLSAKEHCEWMLEGAFYAFAQPALSDVVRKPGGPGLRNYILAFVGSKEKMSAQVTYLYGENKTVPTIMRVPQVVLDEAEVLIMPGGITGLRVEKCYFVFPQNDPFSATSDSN